MAPLNSDATYVAAVLTFIVSVASLVSVAGLLAILNWRDHLIVKRLERRELEYIDDQLRAALTGWEKFQ